MRFRLVKAGFSQKRKTLLNSLSGGLNLDKVTTNQLLSRAEVPPTSRPQSLTLQDWYRLLRAQSTANRWCSPAGVRGNPLHLPWFPQMCRVCKPYLKELLRGNSPFLLALQS